MKIFSFAIFVLAWIFYLVTHKRDWMLYLLALSSILKALQLLIVSQND